MDQRYLISQSRPALPLKSQFKFESSNQHDCIQIHLTVLVGRHNFAIMERFLEISFASSNTSGTESIIKKMRDRAEQNRTDNLELPDKFIVRIIIYLNIVLPSKYYTFLFLQERFSV